MYFVEVVLPLSLAKTFTYLVSLAEYNYIQVGMRVAVPFGKNKIYTAVVIVKHNNKPTLYEAKEIHQILDEFPVVNDFQIKLWQWIASYYMCTMGDVYRGAMPSALLLESETIISKKADQHDESISLSDDEYLICEALERQSSLKLHEILQILGRNNIFSTVQKLLDKDLIILKEEITEIYKPKLVRYIKLHSKYDSDQGLNELMDVLKNAQKQKDIILRFFQLSATERKPISVKKLIEVTKTTSTIIRALVDKTIFEEYYVQKDRLDFAKNYEQTNLVLSEVQDKALSDIRSSFNEKNVCLLHGITSSGKTEVYIKLIQEYLAQDRQILFLVPEIALTTQLVSRLRNFFGESIAVFHSKLNNNERVEVWQQVNKQSTKSQLVIGARSALFLPFSNLGLIIVDEEHEQNFKQHEPAPRYHARDTAIVLASYHNAKVVLGSATPSIETYFNANNGKYGLVEIFKRYSNFKVPEIEVVDLKDKFFRKKMSGNFSDTLLASIEQTLQIGQQVILFQNRRGFAPIIECLTCGHVPQCPNCDVSLTFHKHKNQLRCHYCGHSMAKPTHCHSCTSVHLTTKGFGTEQVQQELATLFPKLTISRMDQDTTRGKFGFEKIIDSFKNKEIEVLVGTQMLAKGLDFDNVGLVGIMNADSMLYHPDFRAFERSFQMMTQVAGRAGRSNQKGKVVIQTYNPTHNIIQQVVSNKYSEMYSEQLYERNIYKYPPYYKLIKITLKNVNFDKLLESARWLTQVLQQNISLTILGPEEPPISRIRNQYIRTILIKIPVNQSLQRCKKEIQTSINSFDTIVQYRSTKLTLNVDFY